MGAGTDKLAPAVGAVRVTVTGTSVTVVSRPVELLGALLVSPGRRRQNSRVSAAQPFGKGSRFLKSGGRRYCRFTGNQEI
jgi:hypothetical protein